MFTFKIIDLHTKTRVGPYYKTRASATRKADKLDLAYGAIRYSVQPIVAIDLID